MLITTPGGGGGGVTVTVDVDVGGVVTGVILVVADVLCGADTIFVNATVKTMAATPTANAGQMGRRGGGACQ
jgi:hypothetical protein